jgi:hypothetical protein
MFACVREGRARVEWTTAAAQAPLDALAAAKTLAMGGAYLDCAEDGFRAVLANPAAGPPHHWGAILGLQGVFAAQGRTSELRRFIDSVGTGIFVAARRSYLLDAIAGVAVDSEAAAFAASLGPATVVVKEGPTIAWLLGAWASQRHSVERVEELHDELARAAKQASTSLTGRLAKALNARLAVMRGDTTTAIDLLRSILPFGRRESLEWNFGEPLPAERLLLAQLLLARGRPDDATAVAAAFDRGPIAYLPFLPASLRLRVRAAEASQDPSAANLYRGRLQRLGLGRSVSAHPWLFPSPGGPV